MVPVASLYRQTSAVIEIDVFGNPCRHTTKGTDHEIRSTDRFFFDPGWSKLRSHRTVPRARSCVVGLLVLRLFEVTPTPEVVLRDNLRT